VLKTRNTCVTEWWISLSVWVDLCGALCWNSLDDAQSSQWNTHDEIKSWISRTKYHPVLPP